ncbi:MAG: TIGR04255 family protein [Gammaproteobacteria bacterium]|jgi:uncharacterized protein (TIGR04255 family)|nr:TIGR04255 family protein [Gammaproteobacteria bacterium]
MTEPLGAWGNAPLAYVLAQVRTEQIADIKEYQPALAGKLRPLYPLQRKQQGTRLVATPSRLMVEPQQQYIWELASPDNRTAIILGESGVVLHATAYVDSSDFLAKLHHVMEIFAEIVPSVFVNRVGLRYIDFIIPRGKEAPEAYINPRLNNDLGIGERDGFFATSVAIYPLKEGQVVVRYARGTGQPQLPPELAVLSLERSPLMDAKVGGKDLPPTAPTAIVDTDRNRDFSPVERLDPDKLRAVFSAMHTDVSRLFKEKVITDHAKKVWGAK